MQLNTAGVTCTTVITQADSARPVELQALTRPASCPVHQSNCQFEPVFHQLKRSASRGATAAAGVTWPASMQDDVQLPQPRDAARVESVVTWRDAVLDRGSACHERVLRGAYEDQLSAITTTELTTKLFIWHHRQRFDGPLGGGTRGYRISMPSACTAVGAQRTGCRWRPHAAIWLTGRWARNNLIQVKRARHFGDCENKLTARSFSLFITSRRRAQQSVEWMKTLCVVSSANVVSRSRYSS
jgi:hypothetical protein